MYKLFYIDYYDLFPIFISVLKTNDMRYMFTTKILYYYITQWDNAFYTTQITYENTIRLTPFEIFVQYV